MPLYDFRCPKCGFVKRDVMISTKDLPYWCPRCILGPMDKLLPRVNVRFKGDGWQTPKSGDKDG